MVCRRPDDMPQLEYWGRKKKYNSLTGIPVSSRDIRTDPEITCSQIAAVLCQNYGSFCDSHTALINFYGALCYSHCYIDLLDLTVLLFCHIATSWQPPGHDIPHVRSSPDHTSCLSLLPPWSVGPQSSGSYFLHIDPGSISSFLLPLKMLQAYLWNTRGI